jgi:hypothetical protein
MDNRHYSKGIEDTELRTQVKHDEFKRLEDLIFSAVNAHEKKAAKISFIAACCFGFLFLILFLLIGILFYRELAL